MIPLRKYMLESPQMQEEFDKSANSFQDKSQDKPQYKTRDKNQQEVWSSNPLENRPLYYALRYQFRAIILSFIISTIGSSTYFLTITYIPIFIETAGNSSTQAALNLGLVATLVAAIVSPIFGLLSDLIGRKLVLLIALVAALIVALPGYAPLLSHSSLIIYLAAIALAIPTAAWSATDTSAIPEQFAVIWRYSGMALGYKSSHRNFWQSHSSHSCLAHCH